MKREGRRKGTEGMYVEEGRRGQEKEGGRRETEGGIKRKGKLLCTRPHTRGGKERRAECRLGKTLETEKRVTGVRVKEKKT